MVDHCPDFVSGFLFIADNCTPNGESEVFWGRISFGAVYFNFEFFLIGQSFVNKFFKRLKIFDFGYGAFRKDVNLLDEWTVDAIPGQTGFEFS